MANFPFKGVDRQRGGAALYAIIGVGVAGALSLTLFQRIAQRNAEAALSARSLKLDSLAVSALGGVKDAFNAGILKVQCPGARLMYGPEAKPNVKNHFSNELGFREGGTTMTRSACLIAGTTTVSDLMQSDAQAAATLAACANQKLTLKFEAFNCLTDTVEVTAEITDANSQQQPFRRRALVSTKVATECPLLESLTPAKFSLLATTAPGVFPTIHGDNGKVPWDWDIAGREITFDGVVPGDDPLAHSLRNVQSRGYFTPLVAIGNRLTFKARVHYHSDSYHPSWLNANQDFNVAANSAACSAHHIHCIDFMMYIDNYQERHCSLKGEQLQQTYGNGCIDASTNLALTDGSFKSIDQLRQGDQLLNPVTLAAVTVHSVVHPAVTAQAERLRLCTGPDRCLLTTANHPFLVDGTPTLARDLRPGDDLSEGKKIAVMAVMPASDDATRLANVVLMSDSEEPRDHWLLTEAGLVVGDLFLQHRLDAARTESVAQP